MKATRLLLAIVSLVLLLAGCASQKSNTPDEVPTASGNEPWALPEKPLAEIEKPLAEVEKPLAETKKPPVSQGDSAKNETENVLVNNSNIPDDSIEPEQESIANEIEVKPASELQLKTEEQQQLLAQEQAAAVRDLCQRIGNKLGSVSIADCDEQPFVHGGLSTGGLSLAYRDYQAIENKPSLGRVLVLGGIHGDEFSSVSVLFKWLKILDQHHSGLFEWRFLPLVNPDGLLQKRSQRQNLNGVDLNRNFPTADWDSSAHHYWENYTYRNPRRYPGPEAASEVETRWIMAQIESFQPDVIIAMHAPYHLVDYDGPPEAPANLGGLYLRKLGVFPGSLGNYVGVDMGKPIVTVELKSAGIMPSHNEIESMWSDLVQWLKNQLKK